MIIEVLTAFRAVKLVWETLEVLHLMHVGHITAKASYKGGVSITYALQQQYQKLQDQKDPAQQLEREAKTCYDLQLTGIEDNKNKAEAYLRELSHSVGNLENAKEYFSAVHESLTKLVHALKSHDEHQFLSQLLAFKRHFESFKDELKHFSLSIKPPPVNDCISPIHYLEQKPLNDLMAI